MSLFRFCLLSSVGFSIFLTSCGDRGGGGEQPQQAFPVQVATPILREITLTDIYTGRFVPVEEVELRARVSGYIESIHFDDGQKVEKGDLMFQIDPRPFDAELAAAQAEVKQGEARVGLAESNLKRVGTLVTSGAVSKEEADIRESEVAQAKADLLASEARLTMAELNREFTEVRAPISGIADRYEVTPGNYVSGGGPVSTMLTTIVPHDPIHCVFEVDERRMLQFTRMYFEGEAPGRDGEPETVEIAVSDRDEFEFVGTIDFGENQLDPDTATTQIRALVENDDEFLTPGLFAKVRLRVGNPFEATLVRDAALGFAQSERFAWVLSSEGTVERRFLQVGRLEGEYRIIEAGLAPDEKIVVSGIQLLQDGMPVAPTEVPMDPDESPPPGPEEASAELESPVSEATPENAEPAPAE